MLESKVVKTGGVVPLLSFLIGLLLLQLLLPNPLHSFTIPAPQPNIDSTTTNQINKSSLSIPLFPNLSPSSSTPYIPKNTRLIILPGFGLCQSDYYYIPSSVESTQKSTSLTPEPGTTSSLVPSLIARGWKEENISVLPVINRADWIQVFTKGLFDVQFWLANAGPTRAPFRWYLDMIAQEINKFQSQVEGMDQEDDDLQFILVGHSAGGWLGRAAIGFLSENNVVKDSIEEESLPIDLNSIAGIVTLGSPNLPPPPNVMDMTRGALRITNENFPGSCFSSQNIFYLTVAGDAVFGKKNDANIRNGTLQVEAFAYNTYEAVCGNGSTIGDGVVPLQAAHLDGATQLLLKGVYHSINEPNNWYGSLNVIDEWNENMLRLLDIQQRERKGMLNKDSPKDAGFQFLKLPRFKFLEN